MFVVHGCSVAVVFCVIAVLCWGSWANARKLAGRRWRFELFYWDHVFGLVIVASVAALTLGSLGSDGRSFLAELRQIRVAHGLVAFLAGARMIIHDDGSGYDYATGESTRTLTIEMFSDENQQEHTIYFSTKSARKP